MKLNQVLAEERAAKASAQLALTEAHHLSQKGELFNGFERVYTPALEDGRRFPPEGKIVQKDSERVLDELSTQLVDLFDTVARKDWANTSAKADVVVNGEVIVKDAPATYLMFLDKQLTDMKTFISKFVALDPAIAWVKDDNTGLFRSPVSTSIKTEKVQKGIVLAQATDKHPAQTQLITEDTVIGTWSTTHVSGAMPAVRKQEILQKLDKLIRAVRVALEKANMTDAPEQHVGANIWKYLFK